MAELDSEKISDTNQIATELSHEPHHGSLLLSHEAVSPLLFVAAVCFLVFLCIAAALFMHGHLVWFDKEIIHAVRDGANYHRTLFAMYVTELGSAEFITALTCAIMSILLMRKEYLTAAFVFNCGASAALLMHLAKISFMRARPDTLDAFLIESGYSFPSGHALVATSFYGGLLFLLTLIHFKKPWQRLSAGFVYLGVVLTVIWSRIYLGVHYPSDVLAGFWLGMCWLSISIVLHGAFLRKRRARKRAIERPEPAL